MAYDYEKTKQAYQSMSREQQQQFVNQNQNDASFQRFMGDYMNEINGKSTTTQQATQNNANSNISNGTNGQNQQQNQKTLETYNQNQQKDSNYNSDGTYKFTATEPLAKPNNNPYDPNETLQTDMFQTPANNQVVVKEGTAQQTGTPDYQLDSDARNKEITDNLNYYWQNNQDYFKDRATYNSIFHYDERSEGQKAILDSYWKKKNLQDSTIKYGTGDSIVQGMNDIDITEDQLNYIKANNEGAYREWQAKQQEMIDKIIANQSVPTVDEIVNKLTDYIDKLDLGSQRYDFMQYNEELKQQYQIDSKLSALEGTIAQMQSDKSKIDSVISKYSNAGADTMGGAAANYARMQRALAPYNESFAKNAQIYSAQLQSYQMSAAQVKSDLNVMYQQTQEDQRIWNNKLKALGFAMDVDSYRTPEQQAQLQLQTAQIQNEMGLLNSAKQSDLQLFNTYRSAKLQNQLNSELTDLSVTDPNQLRANLNNVLEGYYSQYGSMIQRSKSEVIDDVLAYAQKNGVSVAEALRKNFITPLQNKNEYKAMLYSSMGANLRWNADGTVSIQPTIDNITSSTVVSGNGNREVQQSNFNNIWKQVQDWDSYVNALAANMEYGTTGGQCGAAANDILVGAGGSKIFGDTLQDKLDVCNDNTADKGDFVVLDTGAKLKDGTPAGHVGLVLSINQDRGTVTVLDSNGQAGSEKWGKSEYPLTMIKGAYDPRGVVNVSSSNVGGATDYNPDLVTFYQEQDKSGKLTAASQKSLQSMGISMADFNREYAKRGNNTASQELTLTQDLVDQLNEVKDSVSGWDYRVAKDKRYTNLLGEGWLRTGEGNSEILKLKQATAGLTFEKLSELTKGGAKLGILSDSDINLIQNAAVSLDYTKMDYASFKKELDRTINKLQNSLDEGYAKYGITNPNKGNDNSTSGKFGSME